MRKLNSRTVQFCLLATLASVCVHSSVVSVVDAAEAVAVRCSRRGVWSVAESQNFSVWTREESSQEAVALAQQCEARRIQLQRLLPGLDQSPWTPVCAVVLHQCRRDYSQMFPGESETSAGCTTITTDQGRVVFRRIDLRGDLPQWRENALPHELMHVVLADAFPEQNLPAWLNEGLAMLAEDVSLLQRRENVLYSAWRSGSVPPLRAVFNPDQSHRGLDVNVRYAASYSLVAFLAREGDLRQLIDFAERLAATDCDTALREVYHFQAGIEDLERCWRRRLEQDWAGRQVDDARLADEFRLDSSGT